MEKREKTLYSYLKEYATESGEALCLFDEDRKLTVKDTLAGTEAYARAFCAAGIKEGDFVALQARRTIGTALILYALQTIGAVAVLCHPYEEVEKFIGGTGVPIRLKAYVTLERGDGWELVIGGTPRPFKPDFSDGDFNICNNARKASLILFTSGSTGVSKAVMLMQHTMLENAKRCRDAGWYDGKETAMVITPLFHLLSLMMLFSCIVTPYALFFPRRSDSVTLFGYIERYKITYIHGTPTTFISAAASTERKKFDLSSLKTGMMSGGACGTAQMKKLEATLKMTIIQSYGLSEVAGITTRSRTDSVEERTKGVGKVFPRTEVCIKSTDGTILPTGKQGEVCGRGDNVMLGYYNNPEANRKAFDKDGWFHTGDLGYFDEEGILYLCGRIKDIIIRGGENISGAKIENALSSLFYVKMAAVTGKSDELYGEIPCAMVVPSESGVTPERIIKDLKPFLLRNEMPAKIIITDDLPMLGSGKVDKIKVKKIFENG